MTADQRLEDAVRALVAVLDASTVPYAIIGGIAVISRGVPRGTRDVDATLWGPDLDLPAVAKALGAAGFKPRIEKAEEFARQRQVLLLNHTASGTPVDLMLAWLPFEQEAIERAERIELAGIKVPVATAEDLIIFTGEEHGFFDLADASATGSSMMPQKKNPDPLELVRGKTGRAIGRLTGWLATMKGLPSGYNKDLQEDKEAVFDAEATLAASVAAVHAVVSRLALIADRTERAASGLLLATDVADYLVSRGMPFRRAHEVVGAMVRRLLAEGRDFSTLTPKEWHDASDMFGEDAPRAATALASVQVRRTPQSTNPEAVRQALEECRAWLERADSTSHPPDPRPE